jgi:hypothetical protein
MPQREGIGKTGGGGDVDGGSCGGSGGAAPLGLGYCSGGSVLPGQEQSFADKGDRAKVGEPSPQVGDGLESAPSNASSIGNWLDDYLNQQ